jgi:formimidoylglutamate deiminase
MSERLMVAAKATGIQLTIIPIFYQQGGFRKPAKPEQRRFLSSTTDNYLNLLNTVVKTAQKYKDVKVALGVHSLRAVNTEDILSTLKSHVDLPVHIHVAEQLQEVEDCQKYLQNRPVEWLLKNVPLNSRFNLIHATHMTTDETAQLAKSGANVVLCPSTEANLGDGFFQLETFLKNNGSIAIGSDSHIGLSPLEELRWLDYGLRLQKQKRNPLCKITATQEINSGSILLSSVWEGGKKSIGCISTDQDFFTPGSFFDAVCLDPSHPLLAGKPLRSLVPATIFGGDSTLFAGVMRRGQRLVKDGCHESREQIRASYKETILQLFE